MGPVFSMLVLAITILSVFMVGIAISKRLVVVALHLMMMGRLKHAKPSPSSGTALHVAESR